MNEYLRSHDLCGAASPERRCRLSEPPTPTLADLVEWMAISSAPYAMLMTDEVRPMWQTSTPIQPKMAQIGMSDEALLLPSGAAA